MADNYFAGDSQMPVPPEYFLQRVYDYDAQLVLFPSIARPGCYVVARRREGPGLRDAETPNPDTRLCLSMGWLPVCMMTQAGSNWLPDQLIAKLMARDIRLHGGADQFADQMEAHEAEQKAAQAKATRDDLYARSGDGWRTYQARTGASSIKFHDNHDPKAPVPDATVSTASTPRSTAGLGGDSPVTIGGEVQ